MRAPAWDSKNPVPARGGYPRPLTGRAIASHVDPRSSRRQRCSARGSSSTQALATTCAPYSGQADRGEGAPSRYCSEDWSRCRCERVPSVHLHCGLRALPSRPQPARGVPTPSYPKGRDRPSDAAAAHCGTVDGNTGRSSTDSEGQHSSLLRADLAIRGGDRRPRVRGDRRCHDQFWLSGLTDHVLLPSSGV
jgi:hypothetical protein